MGMIKNNLVQPFIFKLGILSIYARLTRLINLLKDTIPYCTVRKNKLSFLDSILPLYQGVMYDYNFSKST